MSTSSGVSLAAFVDRHRRERLDVLTDQLVDTIERTNPGYRASGLVPRADLRRSCRSNIDRILEVLARALDPARRSDGPVIPPATDEETVYDAARATGRRRSEQGLPLDDVLRSFRFGGRLIWDDLMAEEPELDIADLREVGTRLWEIVDATSAQVAIAYHQAERSRVRVDEQLRAQLWEGVLGGRGSEPGFAHEAARTLELPAEAPVVVVTSAAVDSETVGHVLGTRLMAWTRRARDVVGIVALDGDDPRPTYDALARLGRGAPTLGASLPVDGLALAHVGLHQATLALRAAAPAPGLARFDAHLPEALLYSAPDVAAHLVRIWLDPVLALSEGEAQVLLDTLVGWVAASGSATATAAVVHCHRNTVLNRLRRVEEVTGQLLGDTPPVELDLALRALGQRAQERTPDGGRGGSVPLT